MVPYIFALAFQKPGEKDDTLPVIILMCIFTFSRWVHTLTYLGGYQPWYVLITHFSIITTLLATVLSDDDDE